LSPSSAKKRTLEDTADGLAVENSSFKRSMLKDETLAENAAFNDWNYWKMPLPPLEEPSRKRSRAESELSEKEDLNPRDGKHCKSNHL
jgi:hypothetical protein